ncbi:MAG: hypothetical protein V1855_01355 [bacterium]
MNQTHIVDTHAENPNKPFAEIIQSNLDHFTAQSWQWDMFPNFGSLVEVQSGENTIFGCVTSIQTGSMDPMRSPFPYQKTEAELRAEQPQIFEFLQTTFNVQILGYEKNLQHTTLPTHNERRFHYQIPSKPCKIHAFVKQSSQQTFSQFLQNPDFLHLLFAFQNQINNLDELLLAILRHLGSFGILTKCKLNDFCQRFSLLNGNDYRRLKLFLQRIKHTSVRQ